jgi:hypothetical protein
MNPSHGACGIAACVAAAALTALVAIPAGAPAADASTFATASIAVKSDVITAGTQPEITFITNGAPAGAVVYLQEEGAGLAWHSIGRIKESTGTVLAPADGAGSFEYRVVVASATGTPVATSAPTALTVTGPGGAVPAAPAPTPTATAGGCTACTVVNHALPWLALVVDPTTVWSVITSVLSTIGGVIAAFFGF